MASHRVDRQGRCLNLFRLIPRSRRRSSTAIALSCALGLLGCASGGQGQVSQSYQDLDFSLLGSEAQTIADCIEAETGFIVDAYPDGSIGYSPQAVPISQEDVLDAAFETCAATVPQPPEQFTDDMIKTLYSLLKDSRICLANLGFETSVPPSLAVFIDKFRQGNEYWVPMSEAGELNKWSEGDALKIFESCPDPLQYFWRQ